MNPWSDHMTVAGTNCRVRVGNEEVALSVGVTLIGRDASCRITIFDPLISRRHARIQCDGEQAAIEDLDSRNGTRVNGVLIAGPHILRVGDRIGIGSHEIVFTLVDPSSGEWATDTPTGLLSVCPSCRLGYPAEVEACPRCGTRGVERPNSQRRADGRRPDDTTRQRWSLAMLIEMLGKAILTQRVPDAERIMREAAILVSERLRKAKSLDADELAALAESAVWLDKAHKNDMWTAWIASVNGELRGVGKVSLPPKGG